MLNYPHDSFLFYRMSKISTASKYVCALLVAIAFIQSMVHILLVFFSEYESGVNQLSIDLSFFTVFYHMQ